MRSELKLAFFATMSAGKTTCINALLGTELLHSANEATTATITTIHYSDVNSISAYDNYGNLVYEQSCINANIIQQLNATEYIENISIKSKFNISRDLTIVDTPGPNNSRDDSHAALSYKYLQHHDTDYAVYLINATQLGISDDLAYLKYVAEKVKKQNIIFVVNKIDELDVEVDSVEEFMGSLKDYLSSIGFSNPVIFMVSAYHALVIKKLAKRDKLTRKESRVLLRLIDDEYSYPFLEYLEIPQEVMLKVKNRSYFEYLDEDFEDKEILNSIYCKTGFPYFEVFIQSYLGQEIMTLDNLIRIIQSESSHENRTEVEKNDLLFELGGILEAMRKIV